MHHPSLATITILQPITELSAENTHTNTPTHTAKLNQNKSRQRSKIHHSLDITTSTKQIHLKPESQNITQPQARGI